MFKKPLLQVPMKYGVIASGLLALLFVILYYSGKHPLFVPLFLDIRLIMLPVFMFFAMKDFRDSQNGGVLHFWQGLTIGFLTFITVGLLMSVFITLLSEYSSSFLSDFISSNIELFEKKLKMLQEEKSRAIFQEQINKLPFTSTFDLALDYFFKTALIGVFLNIILAVVLRKQPKP